MEYAQLIGTDIESITCICGNTCSEEGMPQTNSEGVLANINEGPVPRNMVEMPAPEDIHTLCRSCGRLYRDADAEPGRIAVVKSVDVNASPVFDSIAVHDIIMSGDIPLDEI